MPAQPWSRLPGYLKYQPAIAAAGIRYGLPPELLDRLLFKESSYNLDVITGRRRSKAGALGIAQFTPATAAYLGINPLNPLQAIDGAARYLANLYSRFGSWPLALAAYNWGGGNVRAWQAGRKTTVPRETLQYVAAISGEPLTSMRA